MRGLSRRDTGSNPLSQIIFVLDARAGGIVQRVHRLVLAVAATFLVGCTTVDRVASGPTFALPDERALAGFAAEGHRAVSLDDAGAVSLDVGAVGRASRRQQRVGADAGVQLAGFPNFGMYYARVGPRVSFERLDEHFFFVPGMAAEVGVGFELDERLAYTTLFGLSHERHLRSLLTLGVGIEYGLHFTRDDEAFFAVLLGMAWTDEWQPLAR
jgi:hypothetical protein